VLPFLPGLELDAEDALAVPRTWVAAPLGALDVAAVLLPRLSNFTDLDPLVAEPGVHVRWVARAEELGRPDLVVLPGTRSTVSDLASLRERGLAEAIGALRDGPTPPLILGLCGGFQMLGRAIEDPQRIESTGAALGLGWLPVHTVFDPDKLTRLVHAVEIGSDERVTGYEIRHGRLRPQGEYRPWLVVDDEPVSASDATGTVLGTTVHGLFENDGFRTRFLADLAARRGRTWSPSGLSYAEVRQRQIDRVADACEQHLDVEAVWRLLESATFSRRAGGA
jgi:adenosylcobyric acid synthase